MLFAVPKGMDWYARVKKKAALGGGSLYVDPRVVERAQQMYSGKADVDPATAAHVLASLKTFYEIGLAGEWDANTFNHVMGMMDRLGVSYTPPNLDAPQGQPASASEIFGDESVPAPAEAPATQRMPVPATEDIPAAQGPAQMIPPQPSSRPGLSPDVKRRLDRSLRMRRHRG